MGSSVLYGTAAARYPVASQADYERYLEVVRVNTPRQFRTHPDFEHAASRVIERAAQSWRSTAGAPFEAFLAVSARRVMPETMRREIGLVSDALDAREGDMPCPNSDRRLAEVESRSVLDGFLRALPAAEREVAAGLALGLSTSEIARLRGVSRSAVNNTIGRLRPKVEVAWALAS